MHDYYIYIYVREVNERCKAPARMTYELRGGLETNPEVWQKRSISAPSVQSSSPHAQAFYDIRGKSMAWKLRETSNTARTTVFSSCFMWQLRNPLTLEYGMKMSTEWKEFKQVHWCYIIIVHSDLDL